MDFFAEVGVESLEAVLLSFEITVIAFATLFGVDVRGVLGFTCENLFFATSISSHDDPSVIAAICGVQPLNPFTAAAHDCGRERLPCVLEVFMELVNPRNSMNRSIKILVSTEYCD